MHSRIFTLCPFASILVMTLLVNGCHLFPDDVLVTVDPDATHQDEEKSCEKIVVTEHGLFPEGVEYDPDGHRFLVSSLTRGTIGAVDDQGNYTSFVEDEEAVGTTGIEVDEARQRLLVCVSDPHTANVAALGSYDLHTGERHFLTDLTTVANGYAPHFANDVAVDSLGNAYVTDSFSPVIYKVDPQGEASIFLEDTTFQAPPGAFGLNGIVFNPNEFLLVAFSETGTLYKIPMDDPQAFSAVPTEPAAVTSPDGLYLTGNDQVLMVVNNDGGGNQGNIVALGSVDQFASTRRLDQFETGPVFPTTVTQRGQQFYLLYAHLDELLDDNLSRDTFEIVEANAE